MGLPDQLTERKFRVLEAVIQTYIETAEPAGSQTIARRFGLGVSSATIRNTMGDLEDRGFLFHPHTSAGRIPTDRAYRWYVDNLMRSAPPSRAQQQALPVIGIPLRGKDPEAALDLGAVFRTVYERAAYDVTLDYQKDPQPPLQGDDATWARELLRGRRGNRSRRSR